MKKINLLNEFFNSKSDVSKLEATEQEIIEKEFEEWFEEKSKDFEFVSRFMIKHLSENYHPHTTCIINSTYAEVMSGEKCITTTEYLVD